MEYFYWYIVGSLSFYMYDIFIEPKIIIYYHQLFVASLVCCNT